MVFTSVTAEASKILKVIISIGVHGVETPPNKQPL
jgi:succinylglutamate desuccinylase